MNPSTLLLFALAASLVTILLGVFALIMALVRYGKQKGTSDPMAKKVAGAKLTTGIVSAALLFVLGAAITIVVVFIMYR